MNVHKLTDVSKTIDERAATFDGAIHNSVMYSVDDSIHKKIKLRLQKWMVPVLQHIDALLPHGCCLSLLELFVKIDTAGRIWLLHAGAVRTHLYAPPLPLCIFVTLSEVHHPVAAQPASVHRAISVGSRRLGGGCA
jgi:hypothetical protein